jgi:hypothetical protein
LVERKALRRGELDPRHDPVLFALAFWLFDLPTGVQWQAASTIGILIAVLSIAALAAFAVWEEWLNLIAGLTLIVSPWLLGFQDGDAMSIDIAIGAMVAVLAALEVWHAHGTKPQVASP